MAEARLAGEMTSKNSVWEKTDEETKDEEDKAKAEDSVNQTAELRPESKGKDDVEIQPSGAGTAPPTGAKSRAHKVEAMSARTAKETTDPSTALPRERVARVIDSRRPVSKEVTLAKPPMKTPSLKRG